MPEAAHGFGSKTDLLGLTQGVYKSFGTRGGAGLGPCDCEMKKYARSMWSQCLFDMDPKLPRNEGAAFLHRGKKLTDETHFQGLVPPYNLFPRLQPFT